MSPSGLLAITVLLFLAAPFYQLSLPEEAFAYQLHSSIVIVGNQNFSLANGVTGGSGTGQDPYVIEGWEIDTLLEVHSTNASFVIRNVFVHGTGNAGIVLDEVRNGHVENSTVTGRQFGIEIVKTVNATVSGNSVSSSTSDGIRVLTSSNISVTDNEVSDNVRGIIVYLSSGVSLHGNRFVMNRIQAEDRGGSENSWDRGYPSGGNYWSDHQVEDKCSGPNQDECGIEGNPDGIGDTPRIIDSNSIDRYPVVLPAGESPAPWWQLYWPLIIGPIAVVTLVVLVRRIWGRTLKLKARVLNFSSQLPFFGPIISLRDFPRTIAERYSGTSGLEAYTASARAHNLSSWVPVGWSNRIWPVFIISYCSTLSSLISSRSYGMCTWPFCISCFK
jgi:parallel beta-helix repeat protein